jgi:hypothetical protein
VISVVPYKCFITLELRIVTLIRVVQIGSY